MVGRKLKFIFFQNKNLNHVFSKIKYLINYNYGLKKIHDLTNM